MATAPMPNHTFAEAVIVNGQTFYFKLAEAYRIPSEPDEFWLPFTHQSGSGRTAMGELPLTLASARKAVIKQVKYHEKNGNSWDRRKADRRKPTTNKEDL